MDGSISQISLQIGITGESLSRIDIPTGAAPVSASWDGTFSGMGSVAAGFNTINNTLYDFDGDGDLDLVTGPDSTGIKFYENNGDGTFQTGVTTAAVGSTFVAGDFDNDGTGEIAIYNSGTSDTRVYEIQGDGTFAFQYILSATANLRPAQVGDANEDGLTDIYQRDGTTGTFDVFVNNGNGTYNRQTIPFIASGNLTIGDINEDGSDDFIATSTAIGNYSVFLANGDGSYSVSSNYAGLGVGSFGMDLADYNGDGNLDFVSVRFPDVVRLQLGNGNGTFNASSAVTPHSLTGVLYAGDMDSDGDRDLIRQDQTNADYYIYLNNGDGTFATHSSFSAGTTAGFFHIGDVTGDGIIDILAPSGGTGQSFEVFAAGSTQEFALPSFSLATRENSLEALNLMRSALQTISTTRSNLGAYESRLTYSMDYLSSARENTISAESKIRDADTASEIASMLRLQIVQQIATAILASANQQTSIVLKLLQGK